MRYKNFYTLFIVLFIVACGSRNVIEKVYEFPDKKWDMTQKPLFEFTIEDPEKSYELILLLYNTAVYPYQNIYINYHLEGIETEESSLVELPLFDKKTGYPLGSGWGDSKLNCLYLNTHYTFKKAGSYKIQLEHFMRQVVLEGIVRVVLQIKPIHSKVNKGL